MGALGFLVYNAALIASVFIVGAFFGGIIGNYINKRLLEFGGTLGGLTLVIIALFIVLI